MASRPKSLAGLLPGYVYDPINVQKDIEWAAAQLMASTPGVFDLSLRILNLQAKVIENDRGASFEALDEIELKFGMSVWGLEARLALTQLYDGLEAQKTLKSEWIDNGLTHAALVVAMLASERNEEIVSYPNYLSRAQQALDRLQAPPHWMTYIRYRTLRGSTNGKGAIQDVLRTSSAISFIDLYDALIFALTNSLNSQEQSEVRLSDELRHALEPITSAVSLRRTSPAGKLLEAARTGARPDGWSGTLVEQVQQILERPSNVESVERSLIKIGANFDFIPLGRMMPRIVALVRERNIDNMRDALQEIEAAEKGEPLPTVSSSVFRSLATGKTYLNVLEELGSEAEEIITSNYDALCAGDVQDRVTAQKVLSAHHFAKGDWIKALAVDVQCCVERSGAAAEIDFEGHLGDQAWQNLSVHADNPDLLLALYFASRHSSTQKRRDIYERYLHYCALALLQARSLASFADLGSLQSIPISQRTLILSEVFTSSVMEIAPFIQTSRQLAEERISVCRKLTELAPSLAAKFTDEIKELTYRVEIQEAAESFDQSRVHVDIDLIRQRCMELIGEDFERYKSLHNLGIVDVEPLRQAIAALSQERLVQREQAKRLREQPKTDADNLLVEIIAAIRREYLFNSDAGLDAVLSLRVRHGSFVGYLRGALEESSLVTSFDATTGKYKDNLVWLDRLSITSWEHTNVVSNAFSRFSSEFDSLLKQFVDETIQVRSSGKATGAIDVPILSTDFNLLKAGITEATTVKDFLSSTLANFEADVKNSLSSLKRQLDMQLRISIEAMLTGLRKDLSPIAYLPAAGRLFDAIASAGTQVANNIEKIKGWFVYASQRGQLKPYSLSQVLALALQVTGNTYPTFKPTIKSNIGESFPPIGRGAFSVADALFIALENVHKHSGMNEPAVEVSASVFSQRHILFRVESQVTSPPSEQTLAKIEVLRSRIATGTDDAVVRQEGGTGLLKLWRMSGGASGNRHIEFGFLDKAFFVEFTIQVATVEISNDASI